MCCEAEGKTCEIEDARGRHFRILKSPADCGSIILTASHIDLIDEVPLMGNIETFRMEFCDESEVAINQAVSRLVKKLGRTENV